MRTALVASRLCQRRYSESDPPDERWQEAAADFEKRAIELLDQIGHGDDGDVEVIKLLTNATMWSHSVLDEAIGGGLGAEFGTSSCQKFVAHEKCQYVLDLFFDGELPYKPRVRATDGTLIHSERHSKVYLATRNPWKLLCYFLTLGAWPSGIVEEKTSEDSNEAGKSGTDKEGYDPDADYDPIYFRWKPEMQAKAGDAKHAAQQAMLKRNEHDKKKTPEDIAKASWLRSFARPAPRKWWQFLGIPRVRFYLHSVMLLVYAAIISIHLAGGWPRARHSGLLDSRWDQVDDENVAEILAWMFTFGRVVEEMYQMIKEGPLSYFRSPWNYIDFITFVVFGASFALRILTWMDQDETPLFPDDPYLDERLLRLTIALFALGSTLVYVRVLGTLAMYPSVGLTLRIVFDMVFEALPILVVMVALMIGFGVAYTATLPRLSTSPHIWERPFWIPLWQMLGGGDIHALYDELSLDQQTVIPLLFIAWQFISTVLLINLLIARMTDTYAEIRQDAETKGKNQKVHTVLEYKNYVRWPPPFNLVYHLRKAIDFIFPVIPWAFEKIWPPEDKTTLVSKPTFFNEVKDVNLLTDKKEYILLGQRMKEYMRAATRRRETEREEEKSQLSVLRGGQKELEKQHQIQQEQLHEDRDAFKNHRDTFDSRSSKIERNLNGVQSYLALVLQKVAPELVEGKSSAE